MIQINTNKFDWTIINQIYRDDPHILMTPLIDKIETFYGAATTHPIVKTLLSEWFYNLDAISSLKVSQYLLNQNLVEKINKYKGLISEIFQPQDRAYSDIIYTWPLVRQNALENTNYSERKNIITTVIHANNIHLFRSISLEELTKDPKQGTIFSNKEKIKDIELVYSDQISHVIDQLSDIFNYDAFSPNFRSLLLSALHVDVCPYCNRQYITNYETKGTIRGTADIDHFYNKSQYPFLALSIYNFIPSCQICNSRFKLTKDFELKKHIYPYGRGFGKDGKFKFINIDCLLGNDPKYVLENCGNLEEIENSINTFHLQEVYQSHKDYVQELVKKAKIYNDTQCNEFLRNFRGLFSSKEEMLRMIFGNYISEEDLGKRPLAKLTKDLLDDLGICTEI